MISFVHDLPAQRVVFAPGAIARVADEAARLNLNRALVIATPGSGARLGGRLVEILGSRAAGLHAQASAPPSALPRSSRAISACRSSRCRPPIPDRKQPRSGD